MLMAPRRRNHWVVLSDAVGSLGVGTQAVVGATEAERLALLRTLRSPRGRYSAERAAQLSGVPHRTVYEWQQRGVWVPDYVHANPMQWSYRDLVFLRMLLFLRRKGNDRPVASQRVLDYCKLVETHDVAPTVVRSDGHGMILAGEDFDRLTGESVWEVAADFMDAHDLLEPIPGESAGPLWQPNLHQPSERTVVLPWVMAGEPCVQRTRVPTSSVWALRTQRELSPVDIVRLYPGLTVEDVEDATELERRLRRAA